MDDPGPGQPGHLVANFARKKVHMFYLFVKRYRIRLGVWMCMVNGYVIVSAS